MSIFSVAEAGARGNLFLSYILLEYSFLNFKCESVSRDQTVKTQINTHDLSLSQVQRVQTSGGCEEGPLALGALQGFRSRLRARLRPLTDRTNGMQGLTVGGVVLPHPLQSLSQ